MVIGLLICAAELIRPANPTIAPMYAENKNIIAKENDRTVLMGPGFPNGSKIHLLSGSGTLKTSDQRTDPTAAPIIHVATANITRTKATKHRRLYLKGT
jgi:hypothetical protein